MEQTARENILILVLSKDLSTMCLRIQIFHEAQSIANALRL